ncbi:MAG TPA: TonB-dependent receptor [Opitutales bacterium]|nr:TonB-dependent receptor [Opitutales bacterium]
MTPAALPAQESPRQAVAPAATGIISGKVVDDSTGRGISGVSVSVMGLSLYSTSDVDGNYRIAAVPAGTCSVTFYKGGYQYSSAENLVVPASGVVKLDFALKARPAEASIGEDDVEGDIVMLDAITVVAEVTQDSQIGLLAYREKSINVSDAIGAEDFTKQGLGDAAEAMSRVTGASVMDGKYVLIRGLGDRYANTLMNGVALPSADPDRRAVQMDQFPTDLLESIQTAKSFTPDLPGDFAGGSVNVRTKSFPDAFFMTFSVSTGYNTNVTGEEVFSSPEGVPLDGTNASNRAAPAIPTDANGNSLIMAPGNAINRARSKTDPTLLYVDSLNDFSKGFQQSFYPKTLTAGPNAGFSLATGDQIQLGKDRRIGYTLSFTYDKDTSFFDDGILYEYTSTDRVTVQYDPDSSKYLFSDKLTGKTFPWGDTDWGYTKTSQTVDWGAFAKVSFQPSANNEISVDLYHNQNANDTVRVGTGAQPEDYNDLIFTNYSIHYTERAISSVQLSGTHKLPSFHDISVDWHVAESESSQDEPDFRTVQVLYNPSTMAYSTNTVDPLSRYFRDLTETSREGAMNVTIPFTLVKDRESSIKFGGLYSTSEREFNEDQYVMYYNKTTASITSHEQLVSMNTPGTIGTLTATPRSAGGWDVTMGWTTVPQSTYVSNYDGEQSVTSGYVMGDLFASENWRVITGARLEQTDMNVNTFDSAGVIQDRADIKQDDVLPALSIVYSIMKDMNIRLAYGHTLARPMLKELTSSRLYDPFVREYYQGNPNLEITTIDNYDLRWEWFLPRGQVLALSAYYKQLDSPIETLFKEDTEGYSSGITILSPRNREEGTVSGVELEYRYDLSGLWSYLENFSIGGNFSLIESSVTGNEFEDRPLVGQSRFVANLHLGYQNFESGTTATLVFNKVGSRIVAVTQLDGEPDIFEQPPVTLNFIFSQKLWMGTSIKVTLDNLLDSPYERTFGKDSDYIMERYHAGRTMTVSLSYNF